MNNYYRMGTLTGGTDDALDSIPGDGLVDGDFAKVMTASGVYFYILDADSAAAESSPGVIKPDTNAGDKRWVILAGPLDYVGSLDAVLSSLGTMATQNSNAVAITGGTALGLSQETITVANTGNVVGLAVTQNDTTNNPNAVNITNAGTGKGLLLTQNGNQIGLDIATAATTAMGQKITGNSLTTGACLYLLANSASHTQPMLLIWEDHASASGNAIEIINDGSGKGIYLDQNGAGDMAHFDGVSGDCYVKTDGDLENTNNSYGAISDERLKQDIIDAASQIDDIKALRVRKFRFQANPTGPLQIGLVAQELELTSPGLVSESPEMERVMVGTNEDGQPIYETRETGRVLKSVKYSVLYMKAIKALQEEIAAREALEERVASIETRLAAMEMKS